MNTKEPENMVTGPIPYRSTTMRDMVSIPFRQTLIHAGLWGLAPAALVLFVLWGLSNAEIAIPLKWAAFAVALAFSLLFIPMAIREWPKNRDHGEYIVEVGMGADLNQDGVIGNPEKPAAPKLNVTVNHGPSHPPEVDDIEYDELPYADRLPQMARGVVSGVRFTFQNWGAPGRLFTQPEWTDLTDQMRTCGYIVYKNQAAPNLGYDFTDKGKQLLRDLIEQGSGIEREINRQPTHLAQFAVDVAPLPQPRKYR